MKRLVFLILCIVVVLLNACSSKDPLDVNVSHINVNVPLERLDKVLFDSDLDSLGIVSQLAHKRLGKFYEIYIQYMIKLGTASDPEIGLRLREFVSNRDMRQVYEEISKVFGDFSAVKEDLVSCFKYYQYYFPEQIIPKIVVYHSGFNYGVFPADSIIGIGAEMYLGADNEIAKLLPPETYPEYMKKKMDPKYIPVDLMEAMISNQFYTDKRFGGNFLSQIVFFGKMRYIMEAMMPGKSDAVIMKYTQSQLDWCKNNEYQIWTEIVDNKLLYITDEREINKFTIDGPFTTGLPKTSPSRVGKWLGWQMVRGFIEEHPDVDLVSLLDIESREILKYYKPNK